MLLWVKLEKSEKKDCFYACLNQFLIDSEQDPDSGMTVLSTFVEISLKKFLREKHQKIV
jgi:hypothetical protein